MIRKLHHGQWKVNVVELLLALDCSFVKKQLITLFFSILCYRFAKHMFDVHGEKDFHEDIAAVPK